jgi:ApbE superfamily uncharacterized protein (UPF0280 family)
MSEFVIAKVEIEETAATIAAEREYLEAAVTAIKSTRAEIEQQIRRDDFFLTTMEPYDAPGEGSPVVKRMCDAAKLAGVGPMATVAGTIAQKAMEAMAAQGLKHGWVDNGGDVAMMLESPATLEVFSDPSSKTAFALELEPTDGIIGICSSSGRMGHSISFGNADVALAMADTAILADAIATAIGNRVTDADSLKTCFESLKELDGFFGGLAMIDGAVSMQGRLPSLVEVEHNSERLTSHSKMSSPRFVGPYDNSSGVRS